MLILAAACTAAAGLGLFRLELRTDGRALVPPRAQEAIYDAQVREEFGIRDPIAVVIRGHGEDGVFQPATLRQIHDLTAALAEVEGVEPAHLASLATEKGLRHKRGTLDYRTLLDPLPETEAEIERLRDELRRIELYDGTIVAKDGSSAAILIGTPPGVDRPDFVRRVREVAGPEVDVIGAPVAEALLGEHVLADLGLPPGRRVPLAAIAIGIMGLVFLAAFRRPVAALAPLLEAGAALVIVFGVMGWLGVPVYLTTTVLPVILTAIGVADEVHVFRRWSDLARERPELDRRERTLAALEEMTPPVVRTSLTTAVGFLSFALSPIGPVRTFGLFAALGILVCMIWTLTVIPALLTTLPESWWLRARGGQDGSRSKIFAALATLARRRHAVLTAVAVIALVALDGVRRVEVQDTWEGGFDPDSRFAVASERFDRDFLGAHLLQITFTGEPMTLEGQVDGADVGDQHVVLPASVDVEPWQLEGNWLRVFKIESPGPGQPGQWLSWIESAAVEDGRLVVTSPRSGGSFRFALRPAGDERLGYEITRQPLMVPSVLKRLDALEELLATQPEVGGVLGPAGYLRTTAYVIRPDGPEARQLPDRPQRARTLWGLYGRFRGPERQAMLVDEEHSRTLVTAYLRGANYADTARLLDALRAYEREHLEPHGLHLGFAGDVAVSQALIDAVVSTQVRSLLLALLGIAAVAALFGRSLRWGLLAVLPPAFAVLLSFAGMGWLGIPLGVATSMFAGMTLGVGVDYSIHLLSRHRRSGASIQEALRVTGPAILIDAAAVGLGFSVLTLSALPGNARLGALLVFAVAGCLAATLLIVPALLVRAGSQ